MTNTAAVPSRWDDVGPRAFVSARTVLQHVPHLKPTRPAKQKKGESGLNERIQQFSGWRHWSVWGWGWWREKNLSCRVCDKGVRRKTFPVLGQSSPFVDVPVYYHFVICHQRRQGGHALGERREAGEDVQGQDRRAVVQDHVRQCRVSRNGATNEQAFVCYTTSSITGNGSGRSAWKQLVGYSC